MDLGTGIAAGQLGFDVAKAATSGWGSINKWLYGEVSITHPINRSVVSKGSLTLEGTCKKPRGIFWLVSPGKDSEYWVKSRIVFHPDGKWSEKVHIGDHDGPRLCFVSVVWVSKFMNEVLSDCRYRSTTGNVWAPFKMNPPKNHFSIVESVVLNVTK